MHKTSCNTLRVSRATNISSFQEHTAHKIILGPLSHNGLKTSSRNGKENINKGKDRQTIGRTDFLNSIHEYKRWFQQKGNLQHDTMKQKIDKLMVMMGNLVTEDKGQNKHLSHEFINLIEVEVRLDAISIRRYQGRFRLNNVHRGHSRYNQD